MQRKVRRRLWKNNISGSRGLGYYNRWGPLHVHNPYSSLRPTNSMYGNPILQWMVDEAYFHNEELFDAH